MRGANHRPVVALLLAGVLIAGCGSPDLSPSPSTAPSASVPPVPTSSTEALEPNPSTPGPGSPSTPPPTPASTPTDPFLGQVVVTVSDGLRVRSEPRVSDDSLPYEPLLPLGTELRVIDGPVSASGYVWYNITPVSFVLRDGPVSGWVAMAGKDGEPWIALTDSQPSGPATARSSNTPPSSAFGSAVIDGQLGLGEWDAATSTEFLLAVPPGYASETVPGALLVMNDEANLYLALRAGRRFGRMSVTIEFDGDVDGRPDPGEDVLSTDLGDGRGSLVLSDRHLASCTIAGKVTLLAIEDSGGRAGLPTEASCPLGPASTVDGAAGGGHADETSLIEIVHPLASADAANDVQLRVGDVVGVIVSVDLRDWICSTPSTCAWYSRPSADLLGRFVIAPRPSPTATHEAGPAAAARVSPVPNRGGKLASDATVTIEASSPGGAVRSITYWGSPPRFGIEPGQTIGATTVTRAAVTVPVVAEGRTYLHFYATDTTGRAGPWQTVSVRIDRTVPVVTPPRVSVLNVWPRQGHLVASVQVSWEGLDGPAWSSPRYELEERRGSGAFGRVTLPARGASVIRHLEIGDVYGYRVRAIDGAGNTSAWVDGSPYRVVAAQGGAITYVGDWQTVDAAKAVDLETTEARSIGAQAVLTFVGNSVSWIASTPTGGGQAEVFVDGTSAGTVTLEVPTGSRRSVFRRAWSIPGRHTITIRVESLPIDVYGLIVSTPVPATRISTVTFEAEWLRITQYTGREVRPVVEDMSASDSDGWSGGRQLRWSASNGQTMSLEMPLPAPDTAVTVYLTKGPDYGIVRLSDSQPVDLYAPTIRPAAPVKLGVQRGREAWLRLEVVGRNPASRGFSVGIDRIVLTPADGPGRQWR